MGLAAVRQSRVPRTVDDEDGLGALFVSLFRPLQTAQLSLSAKPTPAQTGRFVESDRVSSTFPGLMFCNSDTGVQPIKASPYHPGLAERVAWWLRATLAFQTGSFPLEGFPVR